jgi:hemin uptake protein HemP
MRRITYYMRFTRTGKLAPKPPAKRAAKAARKSTASAKAGGDTSWPPAGWAAPEQALLVALTVLDDTGGPKSKPFAKSVGAATFENTVLIFNSTADMSSGSFLEDCRLLGDAGTYSFGSTVPGTFKPTPEGEAMQPGSVIWQISSGTGDFEGASGTITSNFLFMPTGELIDNHLGIIYLP